MNTSRFSTQILSRISAMICAVLFAWTSILASADDSLATFSTLSRKLTTKGEEAAATKSLELMLSSPSTPSALKSSIHACLGLNGAGLDAKSRLRHLYFAQRDLDISKSIYEQLIPARSSALAKEMGADAYQKFLIELQAQFPADETVASACLTNVGTTDPGAALSIGEAYLAASQTPSPSVMLQLLVLYSRDTASAKGAIGLLEQMQPIFETEFFRLNDAPHWSMYQRQKCRALVDAGKPKEAAQSAIDTLRIAPELAQYLGGYIGDYGTREQMTVALPVMYQVISSRILDGTAPVVEHEHLAGLLINLQRYDEAIHEARILMTYSDKYQNIVDILVAAYKGLDGHMGHMNAFLNFQEFGAEGPDKKAGTPDDLQDPLMGLPRLKSPERAKIYEAALSQLLPLHYESAPKRVLLQLMLERPVPALDSLVEQFGYCPMAEADVQAAADSMAGYVARVSRSADTAEAVIAFRSYGAVGPDGKPSTKDDLKDPLVELRKNLALWYTD